jgi:site-specific DNA-methyltransferase (adenine-specific)
MARPPGTVRDAIMRYLSEAKEASISEIRVAIAKEHGNVPSSSVRSYLNLNVSKFFERTGRGVYRLKKSE